NEAPWVGERVEADTVFRDGDFVRLSIESPREGFLYVVDQDQFAEGTTGDPVLIYPWSRGENRTWRGRMIDIPSQDDTPAYFRATPGKANQAGELLTIIVTKTPLNLPISGDPLKLSRAQFAQWLKDWKSASDRFEMENGAGELWTEREKEAASGVRKRQLTRTDPAPQTIYHVASASNTAFFVQVRLAYAK